MKRSLYLHLFVVALALAVGGAGCKMKPKSPTPIPGAKAGTVKGDTDGFGPGGGVVVPADQGARGGEGQPLAGGPATTGGPASGPPLITDATKENPDFFKANIVYFAFDRADVRPGERSKIEAVASHLKSNPTHKVRVEGYCDERGTEEYNIALGDRRATAVKSWFRSFGISDGRLEATSYGEEHLARTGCADDPCHQLNRRAEFKVLKR